MEKRAKKLGQYFTPQYVADFMIGLARAAKDAQVLEPACGEGIFLQRLAARGYENVVGYEVDKTITPLTPNVKFESFVSANIVKKYDLIIGNPPYIRWKHLDPALKHELSHNALWQQYFNSLCDYLCIFVLKSVELLNDNGELIFITPEYWINTKHAQPLRNYLACNGYFSDIIHFNETPIFHKVASSILIFRFVKSRCPQQLRQEMRVVKYRSAQKLTEETLLKLQNGTVSQEIEVFTRPQFQPGEPWHLAAAATSRKLAEFEARCAVSGGGRLCGQPATLGDIVHIGNGMVSGLDRAFQIPPEVKLTPDEKRATLPVVKAKNLDCYVHRDITSYIFLNGAVETESELREKYPTFYELLKPFQTQLDLRYNYHKPLPYWEWAFPRSFNLFRQEQARIFVPCKERISHKSYFRFAYVASGIYPTQDVTALLLKLDVRESIYYILALLNSGSVFEWLKYKGVVKGNIVEFSEKPLASVPVRLIDWDDSQEVKWHDAIAMACQSYVETREAGALVALRDGLAALL